MNYINLGKSGLKVSRICLGTMTYGSPEWRSWVLDEQASRPFIKHALELGINLPYAPFADSQISLAPTVKT